MALDPISMAENIFLMTNTPKKRDALSGHLTGVFILKLILFLIFFCGFLVGAFGTEAKLQGTLQPQWSLFRQPSSKEGETEFSLRNFWLGASFDPSPKIGAQIEVQHEKWEDSQGARRQALELNLAYLESQHSGGFVFQGGLLSHPGIWRSLDHPFGLWRGEILPVVQKYGYWAPRDFGALGLRDFDDLQVQIFILNGSGAQKDGSSGSKELGFWLKSTEGTWGRGEFGVSVGRYEDFGSPNPRNRVVWRYAKNLSSLEFGHEGLWAEDSADGATASGLADGVDYTWDAARGSVRSLGLSFWALSRIEGPYQFLFKFDDLNPGQGLVEKRVRALQGGFFYRPAWAPDDLRTEWVLVYALQEKQDRHGQGSPRSEAVNISFAVKF